MIKMNLDNLIKSAKDGDSESQFVLAEKYYSGLDGLVKDKEEAFYWYYESAENGNKKANERIANFLYYGEIVEKDLEKAKEWYENTDIKKEKIKELFDDFFIKYNENKEKNEEYNKLFTHYFSEINKFDILTKEEENKLFVDYKNNEKFAFEKLVISNLRFVFSQVLKHVNYYNTYFWDYFQEGVIGLIISIKKFDIKLGHRLSSYSFHWINQKIKRALKHYPYFIQIPDYIFDKKENNIVYKNYISLNLKNDDGDSFEFLSNNENPENIYFKDFEEIRMLSLIDNIEMDLKSKDILKMYYGFYPYLKTHTLEEIGKKYNVTRESIRQKKLKIERKVKQCILSLKNLNKEITIKKGYFYMKNEFNIYTEQYKEAKIKHEKKDFQAELALLESIEKNCPYSKDKNNFFKDIYQDLIILLENELKNYEKVIKYLEKAINLFKDEEPEIFIEELKNIKDSLFKKVNEEIKKADKLYDENEILSAYNLYNEVYEEIIKFNINLSDEILENLYINLGDISKELENKKADFFYKKALEINPNIEYLKEIFNKKQNIGENEMEEKEITEIIFKVLENIRKEDIDIYSNIKIKELEKREIKGLISGIEGMLEIKFGIASLDLIKDVNLLHLNRSGGFV